MSQIYMSHSALRNHCCHHLKRIFLNDTTASSQLAIGIIFFLQTVLGIWGNFSLLYHYLFLYHTQCRMRVTALISTPTPHGHCPMLVTSMLWYYTSSDYQLTNFILPQYCLIPLYSFIQHLFTEYFLDINVLNESEKVFSKLWSLSS